MVRAVGKRGVLGAALGLACALAAPAAAARSVDLREGMTPVKHQGERNTCSAFAATALAEFVLGRATGSEWDLSESFAYWAGKKVAPDSDEVRDLYAGIDGLAGFLAVEAFAEGAMRERDWPYERRNWLQTGDARCARAQDGGLATECFTGSPPADRRRLPYRFATEYVERRDIANHLLRERTPVVVNIFWYPGLVDSDGTVRRVPTDAERSACVKRGQGCGGHVVLLVGYDAAVETFVFRNSWGTSWGRSGYGTLPEAYLEKDCEVCPQLAGLDRLPAWQREFVLRVSRGVSLRLAR